ncbi:MAG: hypothetical protein AAFO70_08790, partial [Pseudomonadota bacterium]
MTNTFPSNTSPIDQALNVRVKQTLKNALDAIADGGPVSPVYDSESAWRGSHPLNEISAAEA